jgi:GT2 family glycosyltransferase
MVDPRLSVVVPTFNRARLLERLLRVLDRCATLAGDVEVIVVDDGSTDDTEQVVGRWPHVVYIRQANAGPATARNRGWHAARAPVVVFTDDDTVPDETWLLDLQGAIEASPEVAGFGGTIEPLVRGFLADFVQLERQVNHGVDDDRDVRWLVTANAAFRREALKAVGGFDDRFPRAAGEDVDLSFRLLDAGYCLRLVEGARVLHDHRTTLRGLFRTYHRHGSAAYMLDRLHPQFRSGGTGLSIKTRKYWADRYSYYRREGPCGRFRSMCYLGLRVAGVAVYLTPMLAQQSRERRLSRAELAPDLREKQGEKSRGFRWRVRQKFLRRG